MPPLEAALILPCYPPTFCRTRCAALRSPGHCNRLCPIRRPGLMVVSAAKRCAQAGALDDFLGTAVAAACGIRHSDRAVPVGLLARRVAVAAAVGSRHRPRDVCRSRGRRRDPFCVSAHAGAADGFAAARPAKRHDPSARNRDRRCLGGQRAGIRTRSRCGMPTSSAHGRRRAPSRPGYRRRALPGATLTPMRGLVLIACIATFLRRRRRAL